MLENNNNEPVVQISDSTSIFEQHNNGLDSGSFSFYSMEVSYSNEKKKRVKSIQTEPFENRLKFEQNFKYWNFETNALSANNFDNASFEEIVNMGLDAVPFIKEVIEKGPHPIVHALDLIMPDVFEYRGYISLEENCKQWLQLLRMI